MSIKTLIAATLTAVTLCVAMPVQAKEASAKQLAQREKMKNCNAEAKTNALKGDERKAFMKTCLSGDAPAAPAAAAAPAAPAAAAPAAATDQKSKMKTCNAEAKDKALKGEDRKAFMKTCLTAG